MDRLLRLIDTQIKRLSSTFKEVSDVEIASLIPLWQDSNSLFQFLEKLPSTTSIYLHTHLYHIFEKASKIDILLNDISILERSKYEELACSPSEINLIHHLVSLIEDSRQTPSLSSLSSLPHFELCLSFLRSIQSQCLTEYFIDLKQTHSAEADALPLFFIPHHLTSLIQHPPRDPSRLYLFFNQLETQELSTYLQASFPEEASIFNIHPNLLIDSKTHFAQWWVHHKTSETQQGQEWRIQFNQLWKEKVVSHISVENSIEDQNWDVEIWTLIQNEVFNWVKEELLQIQLQVVHYRVQWFFESLIAHPRPKEQKVGSFTFHPDDPSKITVIFINRDGRLLAQRDLDWDSLELNDLSSVFESIRIRTLVCSSDLTPLEEKAVEFLKRDYEIKRVNPTGLDPVLRPLNLSQEAQKALRLGQRYVAPLRFWIRGDLKSVARTALSECEYQFLEEHQAFDTLFDRLKEQNELKWVYFRRKRVQREKIKNNQAKPRRSQPHELGSKNRSTRQTRSFNMQERRTYTKHHKPIEQIERNTINQLDQLFGKSKKSK